MGIYRGFLVLNKEKQNTSGQLIKLISGGEEMKYQGISIIKHKNCNTWYARYRAGGKQFYISARTQQQCYDKLKEALKQKSKLQIKQIKELKPKETSITFIEWFNKWLDLFKRDVKETTKHDYSSSMAYLKEIYNKPINKITSIDIIEILNQINFERRKQKVFELLRDIFNKALINEVIEKNPILKIDKPKHKKVTGCALTNKDETELENILIRENKDIFLICLYQGLRHGEALALTIQDVDFKEKTLTINKSLNRNNEIDSTKNEYSVRTIPIFDKTIPIFEKFKNSAGRIFNVSYSSSEKTFRNLMKKYFPNKKYSTHSLRHTFITKCQEANIPLHIIQKWVGHVGGSLVTNSVYTHIRELAEAENIQILNKKLNSN